MEVWSLSRVVQSAQPPARECAVQSAQPPAGECVSFNVALEVEYTWCGRIKYCSDIRSRTSHFCTFGGISDTLARTGGTEARHSTYTANFLV